MPPFSLGGLFTFLLCILSSASLYAQNHQRLEQLLTSQDSTEIIKSKADSLIAHHKITALDSLPQSLHHYASWLYDNKNVEQAILLEKEAFEMAKTIDPFNSQFAQNCGISLSYYQRQDKKYLKAIKTLEETILIEPNSKASSRCKSQLGRIYRLINDYPKSLEYYEFCIKDFQKDSNLNVLRSSYINAADVCRKIGGEVNFRKGIRYAEKADSVSKLLPPSNRINRAINLNLARLYNQYETLDVPKSAAYFQKALDIDKENNNRSSQRNIFIELGNLYNTTNSKIAHNYFDKALALNKPTDSFRLYQIYHNVGMLHAFDGAYEKGINFTLRALEELTAVDFRSPKEVNVNSLRHSEYKRNLLIVLPILAEMYLKYFEESGDFEHLKKSLAYFQMADNLIDIFLEKTSEFKSKLFWRAISTDIYGKAIRACYLLKDKERAFYFMEKNKALLLKQDIGLLNYKKSIEIPKELLNKELTFKKKIFELQQALNSSEKGQGDTVSVEKELVEKQLKLKTLQDSLGFENGFLGNSQILKLTQVQQSLGEDQLLLEYHVSIDDGQGVYTNNDQGYVLAISKEEATFYEIPDMGALREDVVVLRSLLDRPFQTQADQNQYNELAYALYLKLFPDARLKIQIKGKKLNIIPDSYLAFIPFEALSNSNQALKYLIHESEFHYSYSISFIEQIRQPVPNKVDYIAFSPENFDKLSLTPLKNSSRELEFLDNYYNGKAVLNDNANKSAFVSSLKEGNIVHIASHADASNFEEPWIAFEDDRLYLEEIYLTENNASLVFLSGCNTTIGKQEIGEGIMSLARGFFYSGAQSVISSLWRIDDASTPRIVDEFYRNLSHGERKSEALHHAKLSYLKNSSMSNSSPHYWASLILLGQDDVLVNESVPWGTILFMGLFVLLLFLFGKRIRRIFA